METMRTLSLTMLLAGCGLHAVHTDPLVEKTELGTFTIIIDQSSKNLVDESFSDSESYSELDDFYSGYNSESFSSEEDESDLESETEQESRQTQTDAVQSQSTEQVHTTTVIEQKHSVLPVVIGAGVAVSVGYAVYKYVTANKEKLEKKKNVMKATVSKN